MAWYLLAWKRTFEIGGRSRRKEYWMFQLGNILLMAVLIAVSVLAFRWPESGIDGIRESFGVCALILLIPNVTCTIRRIHDIGRSGWWILLNLIPFGGIVTLVFTSLDSQPGRNEYGENPKLTVQAPAAG